MADTTYHQPSSNQYILVVPSTDTSFLLQNVSRDNTVVSVVWSSTVPAADTPGHLLQPGDALTRGGLLGDVYARGLTGDAIVAVTGEA